MTNYVEITGNAAAVNDVKLVARVEGYLEKIHYQDGQSVKKGDLLFTIQQDQYKYQLLQAQGQVISAQAALNACEHRAPAVYGARQKGRGDPDPGRPVGLRKRELHGVTAFRPGVGGVGQAEPELYGGQGAV